MEKRISQLKERYKDWVVIATHLHKLNENEMPWIVFEGSEKECLNYAFERYEQDVDKFGNDIDLEVWPEWKYKFYYTDELKKNLKKVRFNATCIGSYKAELDVPVELINNKDDLLSYIQNHADEWNMASDIEFLEDFDPYESINTEDIKEILD